MPIAHRCSTNGAIRVKLRYSRRGGFDGIEGREPTVATLNILVETMGLELPFRVYLSVPLDTHRCLFVLLKTRCERCGASDLRLVVI